MDAENSALPFQEYIHQFLNDDNISQYYCFHCNFDETKADLVSVWDLKKTC